MKGNVDFVISNFLFQICHSLLFPYAKATEDKLASSI